jgi:predicted DNA-binding transcriptional regulator AlpA
MGIISYDLVGLSEVAELCGVSSTQVVNNWRARGVNNVPIPIAQLVMGPVFDKQEIEQWVRWLKANHKI